MSKPEHNERYWEILQYNIDWLRFSETKATVILTVYGIIFTLIYTNSKEVFESIANSGWILFLVLLCAATCLAAIVCAFLCINPTLKNINPNSIIYFGHISSKFKDQAAYKTFAKDILDDEEKFADQITEQIFLNSKIAWKKYTRVTWSLRLFMGSIGILLIILISYLLHALK